MTEWEEAIAAATAAFVESLEQRGFRSDDGRLSGAVEVDGVRVPIRVELPAAFPFAPPTVTPPEDLPRSWHRELSGVMCLYTTDGREGLPWLDVDDFLVTIARWLHESRTGWTADSPDLDMERYFLPSTDRRLVLYGDLDQLTGRFIQLKHQGRVTRVIGPGSVPAGKKGLKKNRTFGYVASIGRPSEPPANWDDVQELLDAGVAKQIESAVKQGRLTCLILRYERGGRAAALALQVRVKNGSIHLASLSSASESDDTLGLRAGYSAQSLAQARVAVIGAGAIGSYVGDLLARSGVGHLTVWDYDVVRPGNLVRHLVDEQLVGLAKPDALRLTITTRSFNSTTVESVPEALTLPSAVAELFGKHDLVIDATAAGGTSDMLGRAAEALGRRLVSVGLQDNGRVVRVDLVPPVSGEPIPETVLSFIPEAESLVFEAGCGDPVSQTPPFAVVEAAALAARCAIAILTGEHVAPAGVIRDYRG